MMIASPELRKQSKGMIKHDMRIFI